MALACHIITFRRA